MDKTYGFSLDDAKRIGTTVKRVEHTPKGARSYRSKHKNNSGGGGTVIYWAKVTGSTDANNYTCDIYFSRNNSLADETGKAVRVWDIVDTLANNDWIPVQPSEVPSEDYECIQQMGAVG